jgi:hypothetical protein
MYFLDEKLYDTNFDALDAHFNYTYLSSSFSDAQAKKVGKPKKNCEN